MMSPVDTEGESIANESGMNGSWNHGNDTTLHVHQACRFVSSIENYVTITAFTIIFILSVTGNAVVIAVVFQQRAMRSITNIYLLNLAIADTCLSVICMPPTLVNTVIFCWTLGDALCKIFAYLQPVVVSASAYTLAVIAFERYYAICRPLHSRVWQTRSHAYAMITLVWTIAFLSNIIMLFMYELKTYEPDGFYCAPRHAPIFHFAYQIYMTITLLLIPLVTMTVLYGSIIKSLKQGMKSEFEAMGSCIFDTETSLEDQPAPATDEIDMATMVNRFRQNAKVTEELKSLQSPRSPLQNGRVMKQQNSATKEKDRRQKQLLVTVAVMRSTHTEKSLIAKQRVIRMLIVIVIVFFTCWTPSYIWWLILTASDVTKSFDIWNSALNTALTVLCYVSSCTNPLTYCFLNKKFRQVLFSWFGRSQRCAMKKIQRVHLPTPASGSICPSNGHRPNRNRPASSPSRRAMVNNLKKSSSEGQSRPLQMRSPPLKTTGSNQHSFREPLTKVELEGALVLQCKKVDESEL